jgi:Hydrogenase/urease nickel incorporation, metallochaperone, hypA
MGRHVGKPTATGFREVVQMRQIERNRRLRERSAGRPLRELSIAQAVVDFATRRAAGRPIRKVEVSVGLREVDPDLLSLAFGLVTSGTALDGARLQVALAAGDELIVQALELEPCVSPSPVA